MIYYKRGSENEDLTLNDLNAGLRHALDKLGKKKKVLAIPPDITRFYSRAGQLTEFAWNYYGSAMTGVLDRIGGGDGFVGGLLYGILKGWDVSKCARFGWATGALAATMLTDYAQPADEDQIWSIWQGNARVKR